MEKKPKFLKNLLTTASAIAVIAGGLNSTALGAIATVGADAIIISGTNSGGNLNKAFTSAADSLLLGGAFNISTGGNIVFVAPAVDAGGNFGQTFTIGHDVNFAGQDINMHVTVNAGNVIGLNDVLAGAAHDVTVHGGALTMNDAGHDLKVNGGTAIANNVANDVIITNGAITALNDVARDVTITGAGTVVQAGTVGRNLSVGGVGGGDTALYTGASDVTGTVVINTTNAGINTIRDANGAVTLTKGNLTMRNTVGAVDVTLGATAGDLIIGNATQDVIVGGGTVTQTGTIARNLAVNGDGLYKGAAGASNVTGTVVINTTNAGINTLQDAAAVTLTKGNLTMRNTVGAVDVTLGATAGDLVIGNATQDVIVGGGTVTQTGTIARNLAVNGAGLYKGDVAASDVTGTVVINTTNAGINTLQDAAAVTLTKGNLTMRNTVGAVDVTLGATAGDLVIGNATQDVIVGGGTVTQTGTIARNLAVNGAGLYKGDVAASDVTGTVGIDTTNVGINTLRDAAAVTLTKGNLTMRNTVGAVDVTLGATAGDLVIGNATQDVIVGGGTVTQTGTIARNLAVNGAGLYKGDVAASDVTGTVGINTTNVGINTLRDAAAVTLTKGNLTMRNTVGAVDVTLGATAGDLIIGNATQDVIVGGGTVTQTGTIARNLAVNGDGLYKGAAGASNVTGTVVINTTNAGINTLQDAAAVTLTKGNLTMRNTVGAVDVTLGATAGDLVIGNATQDVIVGGGTVTQTGTIARNLAVNGAGLYKGDVAASDVTGTVGINTTNVGMNTVRNVGATTVTKGNLTANNIGGLLILNSVAPTTTNITGNLTGITFTTDNTVAFTNDVAHTITGAVTITPAVVAGTGTIDASAVTGGKILTVNGQIGDVGTPNKALKLLKADGGANIVLTGGTAAIKKIDIGKQDSSLTLSNVGNYKIEEFAHDNGKGTVIVAAAAGATVLKEGTVLSKADKKLKEIQFTAVGSVLTVENGVNLFTVDGFKNVAVVGQGSLTFVGSSEVSGVFVTKIGDIDIQGGDTKIVKFNDHVKAGDITIANKGTVQFAGNVDAANIKSKNAAIAGAGEGVVEFINNANIKVDAPIGAAGANQIKTVKISNKDVEFTTAAFGADALAFTNSKVASTVKLAAGVDIGTVAISTVSTTEKNHNIQVSGNQNITKAFGSKANPFGNLILATDDTITITADFFAVVDTTTAGKATVILNKDGLVIGKLGATNQLKKATFQENATVDVVNAKDTAVADTKTATFTGSISGDKLTLGTTGSANAIFTGANLKDGQAVVTALGISDSNLTLRLSEINDIKALDSILVDSAIVTGKAANSTATFNNSVTVNKDIGESGKNLQLVDFSANNDGKKFEILNANIFADNTKFNKSTVIVGLPSTTPQTRTIGKIEATDSTFILSTNTLKVTGATASTASGNISVVTAYDGTNVGNIVIDGAGAKVDFAKATAPTITLYNMVVGRVAAAGKEFKWISTANGGSVSDLSKFTLVIGNPSDNPFVKWSLDKDTIKQTDNTKEALTTIAKATGFDSRNIEAFANPNNTGDAKSFIDDVAVINTSDSKKAGEAIARLQDPINTGNKVIGDTSNEVVNVLSSKLTSIAIGAGAGSAQQSQYTQAEGLGVAAGDEGLAARYGAWAMPFYSQATQKMRKGVSGYKAKTTGGIVGFDCQANDRMTVGAALTILRTDVKHKNIKAGDKTKVDMMMFSVYGLQQIADNWFVQGVASFGSGKVKNTEKRITSTTNQTAAGKYDTMTYGAEVLGGYNYRFVDNATVTPMFGLAYNKFNDNGYKETGTTVQNLSISKKSNDKIEAIIGARVAMNTEMSGVVVTPELHGFIRQDMRGKSAKMDIRLDGMQTPLTAKSNKPAKTFYNLGCSLTAKAGMFEYGAGYDAHLANKYVGHQGTLKVRVNF
ncbi:autotransporter domain-containing protein [Candidatus Trichorickettsia mobilis]|uniref:autotransporter domain-containing protein n=1 Tax=Candidatus Trichorickettsia mobilis TaxID=1346319 RepID=UPI002930FBF1|nr:autotransporter domain-containing protein [Candidatus Trichorickettsia mobilis]